jgi:hypothetical protein
MCSDILINPEFDHIKPLSCGGSNVASNIQALCIACHKLKTGEEQGIHRSSWHSECSTDVHEALIQCAKTSQLVWGDSTDGCVELDIVKCRRWALEKSEIPLHVVSITDVIDVFHMDQLNTAMLFFIDADPPCIDNACDYTAYSGPRWYHAGLAEWIITRTIKNAAGEDIRHNHIIASITCREHITSAQVANTYRLMTEAVETTLHRDGMRCSRTTKISPRL